MEKKVLRGIKINEEINLKVIKKNNCNNSNKNILYNSNFGNKSTKNINSFRKNLIINNNNNNFNNNNIPIFNINQSNKNIFKKKFITKTNNNNNK